jgi:hypothetical protein
MDKLGHIARRAAADRGSHGKAPARMPSLLEELLENLRPVSSVDVVVAQICVQLIVWESSGEVEHNVYRDGRPPNRRARYNHHPDLHLPLGRSQDADDREI